MRDWKSTLGRWIAGIIVLGAAVLAITLLTGRGGGKKKEKWTFLDDKALDELGFVAHSPESGTWVLEEREDATGGRALANHEGDAGSGPAYLLAKDPKARDLKTHTRCKVVNVSDDAGGTGACGVVFRFVNVSNHWVVRANVTTSVVEAVNIVNGRERVVKTVAEPTATLGAWVELFVEVRGDVVTVSNSKGKLFVAEAPSVPAAYASAGLWATSESQAYFDHFSIETLSASPQQIEVLPLLGNKQVGSKK